MPRSGRNGQQRAYRQGNWKFLSVDGYAYLFNISSDALERANLAKRHPERLTQIRQSWEAWNTAMMPIPTDAAVNLAYGVKDMPQR